MGEYLHRPGKHCSSTSLSNVARYYGNELTEAMCFGLASGLDFVYWDSPSDFLSFGLCGRAIQLEQQFFSQLSIAKRWRRDTVLGWTDMQQVLKEGNIALLTTDLFYLDYSRANTYFNGHTIVLVDYDDVENRAVVSDNLFDDVQLISKESLLRAMQSGSPPLFIKNQWMAMEPFKVQLSRETILGAMRQSARNFLYPESPVQGVSGMNEVLIKIDDWAKYDDHRYRFPAIYMFELNEIRGSGGSAFRNLYVEFLEEAREYINELNTTSGLDKMEYSASVWKEFLTMIGNSSINRNRLNVTEAKRMLLEIQQAEVAFFKEVLAID